MPSTASQNSPESKWILNEELFRWEKVPNSPELIMNKEIFQWEEVQSAQANAPLAYSMPSTASQNSPESKWIMYDELFRWEKVPNSPELIMNEELFQWEEVQSAQANDPPDPMVGEKRKANDSSSQDNDPDQNNDPNPMLKKKCHDRHKVKRQNLISELTPAQQNKRRARGMHEYRC